MRLWIDKLKQTVNAETVKRAFVVWLFALLLIQQLVLLRVLNERMRRIEYNLDTLKDEIGALSVQADDCRAMMNDYRNDLGRYRSVLDDIEYALRGIETQLDLLETDIQIIDR